MSARRTTSRDDLVAVLTGALLLVGVFVDGWHHLAHEHVHDEGVLSVWHLPLVLGFNACAIWTITRNERVRALVAPRRARRPAAPLAASPTALQIARLGLACIAAGLLLDAIGGWESGRALLLAGAAVVFVVGARAAAQRLPVDRRLAVPALLAAGAAAAAAALVSDHVATQRSARVVAQAPPRATPATPAVREREPASAAHHAVVRHAAAAVSARSFAVVHQHTHVAHADRRPAVLVRRADPVAVRAPQHSHRHVVQQAPHAPSRRHRGTPAWHPVSPARPPAPAAVTATTTTTTTTVPSTPTATPTLAPAHDPDATPAVPVRVTNPSPAPPTARQGGPGPG